MAPINGLCILGIWGAFQGLGVSGVRWSLDGYDLMVEWLLNDIFPWICLVRAVAPFRAFAFLVFGGVSGSGVIWEEAGVWLVRISGEV